MNIYYPTFTTTGKQLLKEFLVLLILLAGVQLSFSQSIHSILWHSGIIIPFLIYIGYKLYSSSQTFNSEILFAPTKSELVSVLLIWTISVISILVYIPTVPSTSLYLLVSLLYLYRLYVIHNMYTLDFIGHTDKYSEASDEWYQAAATLTKSRLARKQNAYIQGIFWAIITIGRYEKVIQSIDANTNEYEYQGAIDYLKATKQNLYSFFNPSESTFEYQYQSLKTRATKQLQQFRCSECNNICSLTNLHREIVDGTEEKKICSDCINTEEVLCQNCQRKVQKTKQFGDYCLYCNPENPYNKRSYFTTHQKYKQYSDPPPTETPNNNSNEIATSLGPILRESLNVLEVTLPLTKDKIQESYREKSKKVHPDSEYGSKEQFQELTNARDNLLTYIENKPKNNTD